MILSKTLTKTMSSNLRLNKFKGKYENHQDIKKDHVTNRYSNSDQLSKVINISMKTNTT